jgi:hypothetical protein
LLSGTSRQRLAGCTKVGQVVQADLEHIGLHIKLQTYAGAVAPATSRPGADIVLARIFAPYPDPVAFLKTALGPQLAQGHLDQLALLDQNQRIASASRLESR